ncbi:TetR/AcrR family transcriptional regulator [Leucobacter chromiireducens]|uniref:TetR family transcriptional regulator n=1 Tax=Leucobacter chromiireducens subsp. chromiireducens TaxID=660067 RepID=A0ABS1SPQ1_9MICO|nr:TetR family transcriptional regulator [Leucobacter chromiireducens]MBL3689087.1 TetR family transcriptional regulator [Leucobacter chromiireducens subsp. chromiireducens]
MSSAAPKPEGLRARKRRATENAIETSAVMLALELGVENVTVEAICERADISRSTFFNYFPSRDYAIVGRAVSLPEGTEAFSILDSCPEDLTLGVFRLLFAAIGHNYVNSDVARLRTQLIMEQPLAGRMTASSLLESAYSLTVTAAAWLEANPKYAKLDSPTREASLAVTLMHGVITTQMTEWMLSSGDTTAEEGDFDRVMAEYRKLLGTD